MARHEAEREDLMAEAAALRERIEYVVDGQVEPVVAGFRESGQWSLYFGSDPAYHFTSDGALRRAFLAGDLFRSQGSTLARLVRTRTGNEVPLVRHDLTPDELAQFTNHLKERLANLTNAIETGSAQISRQVPEDGDLEARLLVALRDAARGRLSGAVKKGSDRRSTSHD
jgi:hypothetical protein